MVFGTEHDDALWSIHPNGRPYHAACLHDALFYLVISLLCGVEDLHRLKQISMRACMESLKMLTLAAWVYSIVAVCSGALIALF